MESTVLNDPDVSTSPRWILILVVILLPMAFLNTAYLSIQTSNPQDTSIPESAVVLGAQHLMHGEPLYSDFHKSPFNINAYTPGYAYLLSIVSRAAQLSTPEMYVWGRRIVLTFAILISILILVRVREHALLCAVLFLTSYSLWPVACTNRPDLPAIFLSLCGFVFFISMRRLIIALIFFLAAFATKQSVIAAPIAVTLILLWERKWQKALLFGFSFVALAGAFLILLHLKTNGLSTMNLIDANVAPFSLSNARLILNNVLQSNPLIFVLAIAALFLWPTFYAEKLYFTTSLLLALITSAKLGSSTNYFVEPLAVGCLFAGEIVKRAKPLILALFVVLAVPQINYLWNAISETNFQPRSSAQALIASANGYVISDDPHATLYAAKPFFVDPFNLSFLETHHRWDSKPLIEMLQNGDVKLIVLMSPIERPLTWQGVPRLPQSVITTIRGNYHFDKMVDGYNVYTPNPHPNPLP